jgi:phosphatidylserine decarboxylase
MFKIKIIDRYTKKEEVEKVYGVKSLSFLYGNSFFAKLFLPVIGRSSSFSKFYGYLQRFKCSKRKIVPFIKKFDIEEKDFQKKTTDFVSFNDFFIRKLKKESRPFIDDKEMAILPSDARYLVFSNISQTYDFYVKGQNFNLKEFLKDEGLAKKYENGSMVIARLCPADYHRFHFPFDCIPKKPNLINGYLYSVNPIALRKNIKIFSQNKRVITKLVTENFGEVLYIEIGATNVGSIHQGFTPDNEYKKGDEKGFFSLGGSSVVLLFEKDKIEFEKDLLVNSNKKIETKALFGQPLGKSV